MATVESKSQIPDILDDLDGRKKEDVNPYYSAFSTEQEPGSLASKKRWLTLFVHSVREIPPPMGGFKTCGTSS